MECSIYNEDLVLLGMLSPYSLVWIEQYNDKGNLQIVALKSAAAIRLLVPGNFIGMRESDTLMLICSTEDKDGFLWAYGKEAKILLADRIALGTFTCSNIEKSLRTAFAASNPFPIMALGEEKAFTESFTAKRSHADLFTLSRDWCAAASLGFKLRHDKKNRLLYYELMRGEERKGIRFSPEYGNMSAMTRKLSDEGFKNIAYVAGAGEGDLRTIIAVGDLKAEGMKRRELFVDARDLVKEDGQTEEEYAALLRGRGLEKLSEHLRKMEISFELYADRLFNKAFFLGDTVLCILPEYGLRLMTRITGVERIYEDNKKRLCLQLGEPVLRSV